MASLCFPRRRLRVKTNAEKPQHKLVMEIEDWEAEGKTGACRHVYLVTFPHPKVDRPKCGVDLAIPSGKTKRQILECLLDACQDPMYTDARSSS